MLLVKTDCKSEDEFLRSFGLNKSHEQVLGICQLILVESMVLDGGPDTIITYRSAHSITAI
jgi:hypothetical protein